MEAIEATHPVGRVMSPGALWVPEGATLRSIAVMLSEAHIGVAFVKRDDDTAGIVSERDIVRLVAEGVDVDETPASQAASYPLVTVPVDERIGIAARRMVMEDVRHLAVVDSGEIVGVVSARDLLPVLADEVTASW
ncbi:MAG TPA: CBS domain-containing protein [Acidimicrobiales bacterium]